MMMSKAEPSLVVSTFLGRPFGLPLRPFRNRLAAPIWTPWSCRSSFCETGFLACHGDPACDRHIDIGRINVDAAKATAGTLGGDERGAGTEKDIEHQIAPFGDVLDGVGDQAQRLDGGMKGKILPPTAGHGVHRRIVPNIGSVAAMLAQLDCIGMGSVADLVDEDQLMLGTVERAHAGIRLVPDAEVQEITIDVTADRGDILHMSPVHTDEVHRPIPRNLRTGAIMVGIAVLSLST